MTADEIPELEHTHEVEFYKGKNGKRRQRLHPWGHGCLLCDNLRAVQTRKDPEPVVEKPKRRRRLEPGQRSEHLGEKVDELEPDEDGFVTASQYAAHHDIYMGQVSSWVKKGMPDLVRETTLSNGKTRMVRWLNVEECDEWRNANTSKKERRTQEDVIVDAEAEITLMDSLRYWKPQAIDWYCPQCEKVTTWLVDITWTTAFETDDKRRDEYANNQSAHCQSCTCRVHAPISHLACEMAIVQGAPPTMEPFNPEQVYGMRREQAVGV